MLGDEGQERQLTESIIGCAIEVHRQLGPGLLESIYEECLCYELSQAGISFSRQLPVPVKYKGIKFDGSLRVDLLVEAAVVIEIKSVEHLLPVHESQLLTYLKLMNCHLGLLINFNVPTLKKRCTACYPWLSIAAGALALMSVIP